LDFKESGNKLLKEKNSLVNVLVVKVANIEGLEGRIGTLGYVCCQGKGALLRCVEVITSIVKKNVTLTRGFKNNLKLIF
jgi:hypothetical protein